MIDLEQIIEQVVRRVLAELAVPGTTVGTTVKHVTVAAYAEARSIAQSTVRAAIRDGRLQAVRIGRAVRVPAEVEIQPRTPSAADVTAAAARKLGLLRGGR